MDAVGVEGGEGGTEEEEAASALDDVEYAAAAVSQLRLLGLNIDEGCTRASRPACRAAQRIMSSILLGMLLKRLRKVKDAEYRVKLM